MIFIRNPTCFGLISTFMDHSNTARKFKDHQILKISKKVKYKHDYEQ